jgi:hypothetical protein
MEKGANIRRILEKCGWELNRTSTGNSKSFPKAGAGINIIEPSNYIAGELVVSLLCWFFILKFI